MTPASLHDRPRRSPWLSPLLLALLFTILGSLKPMHIDETANYYYAVHIADHPLDPYGFKVLWYEEYEPANHVLTPPVMVGWWALGVLLFRPFGEQPMLWKLWLWPFTFLFVFALQALLRRFARGLETHLLWMTVLGPVLLPGLNLMPDVPALAFSLAAVVVFLHALDRPGSSSLLWACLAGLLTGLAMQTKYTGFLAPVVLGLAAVVFGRVWLWPVAAVLATAVFVAWEYVTHRLYGESHFLHQLQGSPQSLLHKGMLILPLFAIVGGAAPLLGLLGLAALRGRRWIVLAVGGVVALGYLSVAWVGIAYKGHAQVRSRGQSDVSMPFVFSLADILYALGGVCVLGVLAVVAWRLCSEGQWRRRRVEWFLVLWLGLEVAGYFFLSPFPAVRRVMGLVIVGTLLAGRLAAFSCRSPERRRLIGGIAVASVVLGLGFLAVDIEDAHAQKHAAERVAEELRQRGEGGVIWYVGHWGFQYHAEHAGMRPALAYRTMFQTGDWLVLPEEWLDQQKIRIDPQQTELIGYWDVPGWLPFRTVPGYYGGWTPLEHQQGTRLRVEVRRALVDFRAVPPPSTFIP